MGDHRGDRLASAPAPRTPDVASPPRAAPPFRALVEAVVDCFLPWEDAAPCDRRVVLDDLVALLGTQVRALPRRLRGLVAVGLAGFATAVRLRHPLGFRAQPRARRVAIVDRWAFGRFAAARKLFRLIRSTSVLGFFEHPLVRGSHGPAPPRSLAVSQSAGRAAHEQPRSIRDVEVLVIGSGAGGSVTALELAERRRNVLVVEEGARVAIADYGGSAVDAMSRLYRRQGMTPIMGRTPIGYVEGCCVGGSTEVNSGFWHRVPPETLLRWQAQYDLADAGVADLEGHFRWAEAMLGVGSHPHPWPPSTEVLARGAERMGWNAEEVPRMAPGCRSTNACASGCPTGAKQGMSRSLLPAAEAAGARIWPRCRVRRLVTRNGRVVTVVADVARPDGTVETVDIEAGRVVLSCGPTETPALLRRSGIRHRIGDTLRIHPMLKMVARFPEAIDAHRSVLPLIQVKEFAPEITLGGAFFSPGHAAMALSENWNVTRSAMKELRRLGAYYVAARGAGTGSVRPSLGGTHTLISHEICDEDVWNLSKGFARLALLLLAAGAEEIYPAVHGLPVIRSEREAVRWLDDRLRRDAMALTTVHAFSSCPMGERADRCAVDSFGKVFGFENLYVNDASMLPDSPGVNPQGTIMALARRNAIHLHEESS